MRFLVVGLGSMGRRRIRNLQALGNTDIAGFDPRADRRAEAHEKYGVMTYATLDEAQQHRPDAWVVSTPPDLHVACARRAVADGKHVFCEASVVDDDMTLLAAETAAKPTLTVAPSCTFRFHPAVRRMKALVDEGAIGRPLLFTHHSGQWLPDWHPWEDYRTFYVAKRATGACREIVPFELSWLTWLFGGVVRCVGMKAKLSTLDVDIDDAYQVLLEHQGGLRGHLLVDVIARAPVRNFRVMGEGGTLEWDAVARQLRRFDVQSGAWAVETEVAVKTEAGYVYAEDMYVDEMRAFVDACTGRQAWGYSLADDMKNLAVLSAIERSSDSGHAQDCA